jgi:hypothetical protein
MAQITLNSTGVASNGSLVLQSNGTTAAVTIDTSQRAAFVAGTEALPAITTTGDTNTGMWFPAADTIAFSEGGAEAMRIDSDGDVGIGTSSPSDKLTVISAGTQVGSTNFRNIARIGLATNDASVLLGYDVSAGSAILASTNNYPIAFWTSIAGTYAEKMRIDSSGNVGIGTSSPTNKLSVNGNVPSACTGSFVSASSGSIAAGFSDNINSSLYIRPAAGGTVLGTDSGGTIRFATNGNTTAEERMRIDSSGNLLVGTTSQVSQGKGNIAFDGSSHQGLNLQETANQSSAGFMYFQYNTTVLGTITRNVLTNAVLYNTTSDIRLKENIENANSALTTISNIKVRQYDWIGCEDSHQDYGFIAQELAEVVSGIVTKGRTEEDTWAVDYGKLTPILCKAIQEQQALITALTARITALESI